MRFRWITFPMAMLLATAVEIVTAAFVEADSAGRNEVTVTHVTRGPLITPPVIISHRPEFRLFDPGSPASPE